MMLLDDDANLSPEIVDRLMGEYTRKYQALFKAFIRALTPDVLVLVEGPERRKLFAEQIEESPYREIYWAMYDDRDPSKMIWDLVEKDSSTRFRNRDAVSA